MHSGEPSLLAMEAGDPPDGRTMSHVTGRSVRAIQGGVPEGRHDLRTMQPSEPPIDSEKHMT